MAVNTGYDASNHKSYNRSNRIWNIILFLLLCLGSVVILLPFFWMVSTSLKSMQEIMTYPPKFFPESYYGVIM